VTRIVAGEHGGRRLAVPAGRGTRPTSDRVREALFSTLESATDLDGARCADLFAGSGAVGLEALSRGAAHVLLVESDAKAARAARENIAALRASARTRLVTDRVERVLAGPPDAPYDVVFADPPYDVAGERIDELLEALAKGWLAPGAVVVVERSARGTAVRWPAGYRPLSSRRYGETMLWYGRTDDG
jgi:16S rRNA (guanine(966)-N(2))-methyltransferase RsmD